MAEEYTSKFMQGWQNAYAEPEFKDLFYQFVNEYIDWHDTWQELISADQDLRHSMDLQEARLKKHNLKKIMRFEKMDENVSKAGKYLGNLISKQSMCLVGATQHSEFVRVGEGKKLYNRTIKGALYQTIIEAPSDENVGEQLYNCPNCGGVSKINELLDGCPFCNTHFEMKDLFPKVFNSYFLENKMDTEKIDRQHKIVMALTVIIFFIFELIQSWGKLTSDDTGTVVSTAVFMIIFCIPFGLFVGHLLYSMWMLFYAIFQTVLVLPMFFGTVGSKRKANAAMREIDPKLNFEYLEGKALSMIRSIIFAEDEEKLVQYTGGKVNPKVKDIVDSFYRGVMGVSGYRMHIPVDENDEGRIELDVNVYVQNLYDKGNKLSTKNEIIRATMVHKIGNGINPAFSISRISCKNCGGSFNAAENKNCPFCGSEYHVYEDDFVVTRLEVDGGRFW